MRNDRKRKAAFLLALVLMLGLMLTACGGKDAGVKVAGKYAGTYDMTDIMNQGAEMSGIQFSSKVPADFILTLNEDNSFAFDLDVASFFNSIKEAVQSDIDDIISGFMGEEVTDDTSEEIAKKAGYDSYDSFKEDLMNQITETFDEGELSEMTDACHIEGNYTVKNKKLEFSAKGNETISVQVGTIQNDGSVLVDLKVNSQDVQISFVKQ